MYKMILYSCGPVSLRDRQIEFDFPYLIDCNRIFYDDSIGDIINEWFDVILDNG